MTTKHHTYKHHPKRSESLCLLPGMAQHGWLPLHPLPTISDKAGRLVPQFAAMCLLCSTEVVVDTASIARNTATCPSCGE